MVLHTDQRIASNARSHLLLQSSKTNFKLSEHDTKPPISSPDEHQWMGRTRHPSVISHSMEHLRDLPPFQVVCSSKLNQESCSWTELLRVWHYSAFLYQLDNVTKSISLSLQRIPNRQKREAEGTDVPLSKETWTACTTRPTRIAGVLAEMKPCTHNATMPSSSTGCSTAVLQLEHYN